MHAQSKASERATYGPELAGAFFSTGLWWCRPPRVLIRTALLMTAERAVEPPFVPARPSPLATFRACRFRLPVLFRGQRDMGSGPVVQR
jgi:hypothetical protein